MLKNTANNRDINLLYQKTERREKRIRFYNTLYIYIRKFRNIKIASGRVKIGDPVNVS